MKAACVLEFGRPSVITIDDLPRPKPSLGQLLVGVRGAGVGPWNALIREGKSGLKQPLPLILGSELSGIVEDCRARDSLSRVQDTCGSRCRLVVFATVTCSRKKACGPEFNIRRTRLPRRPERCTAIVPVTVYLITSLKANRQPLLPKQADRPSKKVNLPRDHA